MNERWNIAVAGMVGGAALALALVFAAASFGLLPHNAARDGAAMRAYLLSHPEVIVDMQVKLQEQDALTAEREQQAALRKLGMKAFFDPRIAFLAGPANAKTTFVEFFDYNCPYCRASIPAVKKYYDAHKNDTRFSFIEFPIKGPNSIVAARASLAARQQPDRYVAFHFALMNEESAVTEEVIFADAAKVGLDVAKLKADMHDPQIARAIDIAHKLALSAKIDGTPTFLVNGHLHPGVVSEADLKDLLKSKPVWAAGPTKSVPSPG
jgi:protein-disulfide isomerase